LGQLHPAHMVHMELSKLDLLVLAVLHEQAFGEERRLHG
jgi:hypothetical protein